MSLHKAANLFYMVYLKLLGTIYILQPND